MPERALMSISAGVLIVAFITAHQALESGCKPLYIRAIRTIIAGAVTTMYCTFVHKCGASLSTLDYRPKLPKFHAVTRRTGPET